MRFRKIMMNLAEKRYFSTGLTEDNFNYMGLV